MLFGSIMTIDVILHRFAIEWQYGTHNNNDRRKKTSESNLK